MPRKYVLNRSSSSISFVEFNFELVHIYSDKFSCSVPFSFIFEHRSIMTAQFFPLFVGIIPT